jgi:hypothetical protein
MIVARLAGRIGRISVEGWPLVVRGVFLLQIAS